MTLIVVSAIEIMRLIIEEFTVLYILKTNNPFNTFGNAGIAIIIDIKGCVKLSV